MTSNNINMKTATSGRNKHRFLIKESYRIFKEMGYKVYIEHKFSEEKNYKADLFANGKERIVVECLGRPTLRVCQEKQKYRKYCDKLVIVYPQEFIPTFTLEDFFDEVIPVFVPFEIMRKEKTVTIEIDLDTRQRLNQLKYSYDCKTINEVLSKALNLLEDLEDSR